MEDKKREQSLNKLNSLLLKQEETQKELKETLEKFNKGLELSQEEKKSKMRLDNISQTIQKLQQELGLEQNQQANSESRGQNSLNINNNIQDENLFDETKNKKLMKMKKGVQEAFILAETIEKKIQEQGVQKEDLDKNEQELLNKYLKLKREYEKERKTAESKVNFQNKQNQEAKNLELEQKKKLEQEEKNKQDESLNQNKNQNENIFDETKNKKLMKMKKGLQEAFLQVESIEKKIQEQGVNQEDLDKSEQELLTKYIKLKKEYEKERKMAESKVIFQQKQNQETSKNDKQKENFSQNNLNELNQKEQSSQNQIQSQNEILNSQDCAIKQNSNSQNNYEEELNDEFQMPEQFFKKTVSFNGIAFENKIQTPTRKSQTQIQGILKQSVPSLMRTSSFLENITQKQNNEKECQNDPILQNPALQELNLKFRCNKIQGSSNRCYWFLRALQKIVMDVDIQENETFQQVFSQKLDCILKNIEDNRSITEGMRAAYNFCRQLLALLLQWPNLSVSKQKQWFSERIEDFINKKLIQASRQIINEGMAFIKNEDFIIVYARSKVVEDLLIEAHKKQKKFTVIICDNPPFYEGKILLQNLTNQGLECIYTLLSHIAYFIKKSTKVFVGASSMLSNGSLVSRVGTALLSQLAKEYRKPFHVFCETYKFSKKSWLDSLSWNELDKNLKFNQSNQKGRNRDSFKLEDFKVLNNSIAPGIDQFNLRYDLTPCENISVVVTETGPKPPSSIPHVLREFDEFQYIGSIQKPIDN